LAWQRLLASCARWARSRGTDAWSVLNGGPAPADRPDLLYPFRWRVAADAIVFAAGATDRPPSDFASLPSGLQAFLVSAVPAAVIGRTDAALDTTLLRQLEREADLLLMDLDAAGAMPTVGNPGVPPSEDGDTESLLSSALASPRATPASPAAAALWERLREGPVPEDELRTMGTRFGLLPRTLVDALDRAGVSRWGIPVTCEMDGHVRLTSDAERRRVKGGSPFAC
jgi:hypothetical protein